MGSETEKAAIILSSNRKGNHPLPLVTIHQSNNTRLGIYTRALIHDMESFLGIICSASGDRPREHVSLLMYKFHNACTYEYQTVHDTVTLRFHLRQYQCFPSSGGASFRSLNYENLIKFINDYWEAQGEFIH